MNALQRDFEIKLKRVDQKGIYHGTITINKKDYALDLLENGHAVVMSRNKNPKYEDAEGEARKNKVGLWKKEMNLASIKGGDIEK